jgi:hypothetical protein
MSLFRSSKQPPFTLVIAENPWFSLQSGQHVYSPDPKGARDGVSFLQGVWRAAFPSLDMNCSSQHVFIQILQTATFHIGNRRKFRLFARWRTNVKGGCLEDLNKDMLRTAVHIWCQEAIIDIPEGEAQYPGSDGKAARHTPCRKDTPSRAPLGSGEYTTCCELQFISGVRRRLLISLKAWRSGIRHRSSRIPKQPPFTLVIAENSGCSPGGGTVSRKRWKSRAPHCDYQCERWLFGGSE